MFFPIIEIGHQKAINDTHCKWKVISSIFPAHNETAKSFLTFNINVVVALQFSTYFCVSVYYLYYFFPQFLFCHHFHKNNSIDVILKCFSFSFVSRFCANSLTTFVEGQLFANFALDFLPFMKGDKQSLVKKILLFCEQKIDTTLYFHFLLKANQKIEIWNVAI